MPADRQQDRKSTPTGEQLRRNIDRGKTRDKVAADDPDAAPLGTGDEASGKAASPSRIARGILQESARPRVSGAPWTLIALALGIVAIIMLAWRFAR
jgi:hypothetical protein